MTPKERVHAALNRRPVDRVPVFMWFHPETAVLLGEVLEIPPARVAEAMGNDVCQVWVGNNHAMEGITHERDGETHVDFWGIEWVKVGPFNQILRSPLENADYETILRYEYPWDSMEYLLSNMERIIGKSCDYFIGCDVSPCLFEMICRLRGMENALTDLVANPELSERMLKAAGVFSAALSEKACERFPLDWLWTGDDIGGQTALLMSPRCWRELIRPKLERIFDIGKSHGLWVAYHSCGSVRPVIPDLIEMGLDVLNPIQSTCPGMDPVELKSEFGRDLAFMGGIDTQRFLPNATAAEVRNETERFLETMTADGGGYILAASHTIPPETPMDNIFALYEAAGLTCETIFDRASDIRRETGASRVFSAG